MKVTLIAHTQIASDETSRWLTDAWIEFESSSADSLAEFAGRACYESWSRPNPKTALNRDYLANILAQEHFSVLEHASATFYVEGVSRTLTHELVRHRHLSYSQRSQRYVDESSSVGVVPDDLRAIRDVALGSGETVQEAVDELHDRSLELYQNVVRILRDEGRTVKEARGAARAVLPASTETSIVVTGNHQAWRHFLSKRWHVAAEKEIRQLAGRILVKLHGIAPNIYQDFDLIRPVGTPPENA